MVEWLLFMCTMTRLLPGSGSKSGKAGKFAVLRKEGEDEEGRGRKEDSKNTFISIIFVGKTQTFLMQNKAKSFLGKTSPQKKTVTKTRSECSPLDAKQSKRSPLVSYITYSST